MSHWRSLVCTPAPPTPHPIPTSAAQPGHSVVRTSTPPPTHPPTPPTPPNPLQITVWLNSREGTDNTGLDDNVRAWLQEANTYLYGRR